MAYRQHHRLVAIQNPRLREMAIDRIHSETFPTWFDKHVSNVLKILKIRLDINFNFISQLQKLCRQFSENRLMNYTMQGIVK